MERGAGAAVSDIVAPLSVGELLDKITILEIKAERITDPASLANVERELAALRRVEVNLPPIPAG
jgi:hypothetical protein